MARRKASQQALIFEELEPRLLFSADGVGAVVAAPVVEPPAAPALATTTQEQAPAQTAAVVQDAPAVQDTPAQASGTAPVETAATPASGQDVKAGPVGADGHETTSGGATANIFRVSFSIYCKQI